MLNSYFLMLLLRSSFLEIWHSHLTVILLQYLISCIPNILWWDHKSNPIREAKKLIYMLVKCTGDPCLLSPRKRRMYWRLYLSPFQPPSCASHALIWQSEPPSLSWEEWYTKKSSCSEPNSSPIHFHYIKVASLLVTYFNLPPTMKWRLENLSLWSNRDKVAIQDRRQK